MRPRPYVFYLLSILFAIAILVSQAPRTPSRADPSGSPRHATAPVLPERQAFSLHTLQRLRARLDNTDMLAALRAVHVALSQISDGATFIWRKKSRQLSGVIKPTMAFRNVDGQICRHLIYSLSLGRYVKSIEGVACRGADGRWRLAG